MHLSPQVTLSWVQILCAVSSLVFVHDEARQLRFFEAQMLLAAVQSPQYSFGGKNLQRNPQLKQSSEVGPAQFGTVHAVGKQIASVNATAPDFSFGNADRAQVSKLYVPGAAAGDTKTPGPIYEINHAVGKQLSSEKDNAPIFTFGSSKREHVGKVYMPQSVGKKNRPDEFMRAVPSQ